MSDIATGVAESTKHDWTVDPETGRSNSSPEFLDLAQFVGNMVRVEARGLLNGGSPESAGRLIMAQLAHVKNVGPLTAEIIEA